MRVFSGEFHKKANFNHFKIKATKQNICNSSSLNKQQLRLYY